MRQEQFDKSAQSADHRQPLATTSDASATSTGNLKTDRGPDQAQEGDKDNQTLSLLQSNVAVRNSPAPSIDSEATAGGSLEACPLGASHGNEQVQEADASSQRPSLTASDLARVESDNDYVLSQYLDQSVEEEPWRIDRSRRDEFVRDCEQVRICFGGDIFCQMLLINGRRGSLHMSAMLPQYPS